MSVRIAKSDAELRKISEVLLHLRSAYDTESLISRIREQMQSGYQVAYVESGDEVLCVAGFVTQQKLAWGKHIYVDDLVTSEHHRSRGAGAKMIAWLKAYARRTAGNSVSNRNRE